MGKIVFKSKRSSNQNGTTNSDNLTDFEKICIINYLFNENKNLFVKYNREIARNEMIKKYLNSNIFVRMWFSIFYKYIIGR